MRTLWNLDFENNLLIKFHPPETLIHNSPTLSQKKPCPDIHIASSPPISRTSEKLLQRHFPLKEPLSLFKTMRDTRHRVNTHEKTARSRTNRFAKHTSEAAIPKSRPNLHRRESPPEYACTRVAHLAQTRSELPSPPPWDRPRRG